MTQVSVKCQNNRFVAKSGQLKEDAFFSILKLHKVDLEPSQVSKIKKECSKKKAGSSDLLINYTEALAIMNVDLGEAAVRDEIKWGVASQTKERK